MNRTKRGDFLDGRGKLARLFISKTLEVSKHFKLTFVNQEFVFIKLDS